jgi:hypothetical protein
MADGALLITAFLFAFCGMGGFALSMTGHWTQVCGAAPRAEATRQRLRYFGAADLLLSLGACLLADRASMACLVWIMMVSASTLLLALTLAYAPRSLYWLSRVAGASRRSA